MFWPPRRIECVDKSGPRAVNAGPTAQEQGDVPMQDVAYGFCHCGCGEKTNIATNNHAKSGAVRGEPQRYIAQHHRRSSPVQYQEEDRGHETPCWVWQLYVNEAGYGHIGEKGRTRKAHRVYYERFVGPIPQALELDHLCRVPACVNPAHLEPVTPAENVRRGAHTRLTLAQARFIKRSPKGNRALAAELGVHESTISAVRTGISWKDA